MYELSVFKSFKRSRPESGDEEGQEVYFNRQRIKTAKRRKTIDEKPILTCPHCDREFRYDKPYERHLREHNLPEWNEDTAYNDAVIDEIENQPTVTPIILIDPHEEAAAAAAALLELDMDENDELEDGYYGHFARNVWNEEALGSLSPNPLEADIAGYDATVEDESTFETASVEVASALVVDDPVEEPASNVPSPLAPESVADETELCVPSGPTERKFSEDKLEDDPAASTQEGCNDEEPENEQLASLENFSAVEAATNSKGKKRSSSRRKGPSEAKPKEEVASSAVDDDLADEAHSLPVPTPPAPTAEAEYNEPEKKSKRRRSSKIKDTSEIESPAANIQVAQTSTPPEHPSVEADVKAKRRMRSSRRTVESAKEVEEHPAREEETVPAKVVPNSDDVASTGASERKKKRRRSSRRSDKETFEAGPVVDEAAPAEEVRELIIPISSSSISSNKSAIRRRKSRKVDGGESVAEHTEVEVHSSIDEQADKEPVDENSTPNEPDQPSTAAVQAITMDDKAEKRERKSRRSRRGAPEAEPEESSNDKPKKEKRKSRKILEDASDVEDASELAKVSEKASTDKPENIPKRRRSNRRSARYDESDLAPAARSSVASNDTDGVPAAPAEDVVDSVEKSERKKRKNRRSNEEVDPLADEVSVTLETTASADSNEQSEKRKRKSRRSVEDPAANEVADTLEATASTDTNEQSERNKRKNKRRTDHAEPASIVAAEAADSESAAPAAATEASTAATDKSEKGKRRSKRSNNDFVPPAEAAGPVDNEPKRRGRRSIKETSSAKEETEAEPTEAQQDTIERESTPIGADESAEEPKKRRSGRTINQTSLSQTAVERTDDEKASPELSTEDSKKSKRRGRRNMKETTSANGEIASEQTDAQQHSVEPETILADSEEPQEPKKRRRRSRRSLADSAEIDGASQAPSTVEEPSSVKQDLPTTTAAESTEEPKKRRSRSRRSLKEAAEVTPALESDKDEQTEKKQRRTSKRRKNVDAKPINSAEAETEMETDESMLASEKSAYKMDESTEEKPTFTCAVCERSFKYEGNYKKHLLVHEEDNEMEKSVGEEKIAMKKDDSLLESDKSDGKEESNSEAKPSFTCSACERTFKYEGNYRKHLQTHEEEEDDDEKTEDAIPAEEETLLDTLPVTAAPSKELSCPICERKYKYEGHFKKHLLTHEDEGEDEKPEPVKEDPTLHSKQFNCPTCERTFKYEGNYKKHLLTHDGNDVSSMDTSADETTDDSLLAAHPAATTAASAAETEGKQSFACTICRRRYENEWRYKRHMVAHATAMDISDAEDDSSVIEADATQSGKSGDRSARQWKTIDDTPQLTCRFCDRSFKYDESYNKHMLAHGNDHSDATPSSSTQFLAVISSNMIKWRISETTVNAFRITSEKRGGEGEDEEPQIDDSAYPERTAELRCAICECTFKYERVYRVHMAKHQEEEEFEECEAEFPAKDNVDAVGNSESSEADDNDAEETVSDVAFTVNSIMETAAERAAAAAAAVEFIVDAIEVEERAASVARLPAVRPYRCRSPSRDVPVSRQDREIDEGLWPDLSDQTSERIANPANFCTNTVAAVKDQRERAADSSTPVQMENDTRSSTGDVCTLQTGLKLKRPDRLVITLSKYCPVPVISTWAWSPNP